MRTALDNKICIMLMLLAFTQVSMAVDKQAGVSTPVLIEDLRGGGFIIYMRHAQTDHNQKDQGVNRLDSCSMQRNLSEGGREQARRIGKIIASQDIPIGEVYSSPYCRCKETAQIAFSKLKVENDLQFSISKSQDESKYLGERLKEMMLNADTTKGNVVFVGHTSNLKDGLGVWPKPEGTLVIFKKIDSEITFKGMITPEELLKL